MFIADYERVRSIDEKLNGDSNLLYQLKFIYFEKATKFCEISTVDLTVTTQDKYKVEVLQNLVAFSKYMNFIWLKFSMDHHSFYLI